MASTDSELKAEVKNFIGDSVDALSTDEFDQAFNSAKRHIRVRKNITNDDFDYYSTVHREDAMFWWTCLFTKVATGELDAQQMQVGAIDIDELLARDEGTVVTWLRNALTALKAVDSGGDNPYGTGITSVTRENRSYEGGAGGGTGDSDLGELGG